MARHQAGFSDRKIGLVSLNETVWIYRQEETNNAVKLSEKNFGLLVKKDGHRSTAKNVSLNLKEQILICRTF